MLLKRENASKIRKKEIGKILRCFYCNPEKEGNH